MKNKVIFFLIMSCLILMSCSSLKPMGVNVLGKSYYHIDKENVEHFKLSFSNESRYDIKNSRCLGQQRWGLYKIISKKKIILFDEDFEGTIYDTLTYNNRNETFSSGSREYRKFDKKLINNFRKSNINVNNFSKSNIDTLFNCPPVILRRKPKKN